MRTKLSTVSNLMLLFYRSMACAVYLRKIIAFTVIFHIACISHYKSIKSIDDNLYKEIIDTKSKQNCKLRTRYTAKDKGYSISATTIITELKTDLIFLLLRSVVGGGKKKLKPHFKHQ